MATITSPSSKCDFESSPITFFPISDVDIELLSVLFFGVIPEYSDFLRSSFSVPPNSILKSYCLIVLEIDVCFYRRSDKIFGRYEYPTTISCVTGAGVLDQEMLLKVRFCLWFSSSAHSISIGHSTP
jgi:hypothetical protein